ncbi:hypothetical protein F4679DRAFT_595052 [Xylaria curta]|nr:hypothetical protein F4679DRAFT_595052 [Xylaria curta]
MSSKRLSSSPLDVNKNLKNWDPDPEDRELLDSDDTDLAEPNLYIGLDAHMAELNNAIEGFSILDDMCKKFVSCPYHEFDQTDWNSIVDLWERRTHEFYDIWMASQSPAASQALKQVPHRLRLTTRFLHSIQDVFKVLNVHLQRSPKRSDVFEHAKKIIIVMYQHVAMLLEVAPHSELPWRVTLAYLANLRSIITQNKNVRRRWITISKDWHKTVPDLAVRRHDIYHDSPTFIDPSPVVQLSRYVKPLMGAPGNPIKHIAILLESVAGRERDRIVPAVHTTFDNMRTTSHSRQFRDGLELDGRLPVDLAWDVYLPAVIRRICRFYHGREAKGFVLQLIRVIRQIALRRPDYRDVFAYWTKINTT